MEKSLKQQEITISTQTEGISQSKKFCEVCGAPLKRGKQFCSKACAAKARGDRLPKTKCLNCGKEIRMERANRPRKFCSIECKNEMRLKNSNPRYVKWQKTRAAIKAEHGQCTKCGATENLHVHHIDHDTKNNDVENLIVLCQSCHMKYHRLHDYQAMTFEQFMTLK